MSRYLLRHCAPVACAAVAREISVLAAAASSCDAAAILRCNALSLLASSFGSASSPAAGAAVSRQADHFGSLRWLRHAHFRRCRLRLAAARRAVSRQCSATMRRRRRSRSSGPKPGIPSGSLKSQAFSSSPTKSRMAGSAAQARRSAARVRVSAARRSAEMRVMSVSARDRIDRWQARRDRIPARRRVRCGAVSRLLRFRAAGRRNRFACFGSSSAFAGLALAARPALEEIFRLAHLRSSVSAAAPRQRFGVGAVALALHECALDMVLGHEGRNRVAATVSGIGTGSTRSFAGFRQALAFGRIGGDDRKLVGRLALGRPQHHPQRRRADREIVAIVRGFRCDRARCRPRRHKTSRARRRRQFRPGRACPARRQAR